MGIVIEQINRMDKDFLKHIYTIRKRVFEEELGFTKKDRMCYNEWDALSNHYMALVDGVPAGSIAVVDWTNIKEALENRGLDFGPKTAKVTKLAILPEHRSIQTLKTLVEPVKKEVEGSFDYLIAEVAPPINQPQDNTRYKFGEKYQHIFGLDLIAKPSLDGVVTHVLGKPLR